MQKIDSASLDGAFLDGKLAREFGSCPDADRPAPCVLVIFGASGDLTARKLIPALFRLVANGLLPEATKIIGVSRTQFAGEAFRQHVLRALEDAGCGERGAWDAFASRISYLPLGYDDAASYGRLAAAIRTSGGAGGNTLFYLATPPAVYGVVAEHLAKAGLAEEKDGAYSRIVVEKPFGRDLETARKLDATLHAAYSEHQIFRIDHYLAKETVQNILMFRFANAIFEPIWNRRYIASITCASSESLGVGHRAGYYEHSGVLRDMFQNHMMQLLALSAIEPPSVFEAERVRDEKVKLYRALRPFAPDRLRQHLVLGQYTAGEVGGESVPAYRDEAGVSKTSITPTFAMLTAFVDNWRWQGVPFHIMSGKRLKQKLTRIVIRFRDVPHSMFRGVESQDFAPNRLVLDVAPDNAISLEFQAKKPGSKLCFTPVKMRYDFGREIDGVGLGAYEKVLLDCMLGDHMLFWRQDAVELCWGYLTPILDLCESCGDAAEHLHTYPAGSWGPEASLQRVKTLF